MENQRFFVFHRKRLWNPGEGKWMGWERKRGKLHEFNRLLRGATDTSFLPIDGKPAVAPPGVCYVITLDADTKLPMGVVSQLVGVAAHPLNQPVFDPDTPVCRGWLRHSPATRDTDPAAPAGALNVSPDFCRRFRDRCLCQLGIRTLSGSVRTRHLQR